MPEILIANGMIVDGTGDEGFKGHITISGERIESVTLANSLESEKILEQSANTVINAQDLVVSPGFIDCHSHFDWMLPLPDHETFLYPVVEQGVTTVITGNCGYSPAPVTPDSSKIVSQLTEFVQQEPLSFEWEGVGDFIDYLNAPNRLLFNNAQLLGHGPLHIMTAGDVTAQPSAGHMDKMVYLIEKAMDEGAFGLSLGLMYPPGIFSKQKDLETLAGAVAKKGRILTVHTKALSRYSMAYPLIPFIGKPHNLKALDEIIAIGLETGVKLQISHLIFVGKSTWGTVDKAIDKIEKARKKGLRVMWDIYPHFCGNSYLTVFISEWFLENLEENLENPKAIKKLKLESKIAAFLLGFKLSDIQIMDANYPQGQKYNGMNLEQIGRLEGLDPMDVLLKIVKESNGQALQLTHGYSGNNDNEQVLKKLMGHDLCLFETDTLLKKEGFPNPASYGAFPRILGRFVREKKYLGLADAISKMTGKTARWYNIVERGEIKPGYFADLTLFDPDTVADLTTQSDTARRPAGIEKVLMNGEIVVDNGKYIPGIKPGKSLKYGE